VDMDSARRSSSPPEDCLHSQHYANQFREPYLYSIWKEVYRADLFQEYSGQSLCLNQWLKEFNKTEKIEEGEALIRFMGSQQSRFLCGYECFLPKNKSMNDDSFLLARAKKNLPKIDCLGTTEQLFDLIPQLKVHLRWLPVGSKIGLKQTREVPIVNWMKNQNPFLRTIAEQIWRSTRWLLRLQKRKEYRQNSVYSRSKMLDDCSCVPLSSKTMTYYATLHSKLRKEILVLFRL